MGIGIGMTTGDDAILLAQATGETAEGAVGSGAADAADAAGAAGEAIAAAPETAEDLIGDLTEWMDPALAWLETAFQTVSDQYLSIDGLLRLGIIFGVGALAWLLARPARHLLEKVWPSGPTGEERRGLLTVERLVFPILWIIGLWIATGVLARLGMNNDLLRVAASLLNAWVVIRLVVSFVHDPVWRRTLTIFAWTIAALNILKLLNPAIALLDSAAMNIGETRVSLYLIIKGGLLALFLLWAATVLSGVINRRVRNARSLTPSVQTLVGHAVRLGLIFAAILMAMNAIGVDLTALAVFSGAIGIGIGFGLQAIFSNLVAGIIMLFEGSIKVGDFVDLENGLTGEVKEINIRATRVTTNDNVDILVPNAEFINNRVTNWTLKEGHRRTRIPFGVAYGTDKELVKKAALEAAATVDHELKGPGATPAQVWLVGFGDSSLDFELVVWLAPASVKRPARVAADYNWALETALGKYGIEIPFPQRDLHVRSGRLPIRIDRDREAEETA